MYIWLLISKAEQQAEGARAKANAQNPTDPVRKAGGTPPSRKAGEGACIVDRSETTQAPSPAFRLAP